MENSETATLIQIHPDDNVGVLTQSVRAGQAIVFQDLHSEAAEDYVLGHKFALQAIAKGEKILKYGISIGSAISDIGQLEHVHLHNLQSDYLPTFTLDDERNFEG